MARTKLTARKSDTGYIPPRARAPAATWVHQPETKSYSDGLRAGGPARELQTLLQGLVYEKMPVYVGRCAPMEGHGYNWSVKVTIFKRTADDGYYQVERVHEAIAQHVSFDAGIRDATL